MKLKHMKKENGQAMVEFALVLPILLLFIAGVIDFGWIFHNQLAANNACRETARYIAIHYYFSDMKNISLPETEGSAEKISKTKIENYVLPNITEIVVSDINPVSDGEGGYKLTVSFNGKVKILTPILSTILGSDYYTVNANCTMRAEK